MLQKEVEHTPSTKTDAAAAFLASLEEPKLTSLAEAGKKLPIEILPPGVTSLSLSISVKKLVPGNQHSQQEAGQQLLLEAPPAPRPVSAPLQSESTTAPVSALLQLETTMSSVSAPLQSESTPVSMSASLQSESSGHVSDSKAPGAAVSDPDSVASGESIEAASILTKAESPPQVPESQETNVPTSVPTSDPLA